MILQRKLELARVSSLNALLLYPQARLYLPHLCGLRTHPQHVCTHTHTPTYSHTHTQEERPHPSQAGGSTCPPVPAPRPPQGDHPLTSPLGFSLSYVAASPWAPRTPAPPDLRLPPAAALGSPSVRSRAQKTVRACARAASLLSRRPPPAAWPREVLGPERRGRLSALLGLRLRQTMPPALRPQTLSSFCGTSSAPPPLQPPGRKQGVSLDITGTSHLLPSLPSASNSCHFRSLRSAPARPLLSTLTPVAIMRVFANLSWS